MYSVAVLGHNDVYSVAAWEQSNVYSVAARDTVICVVCCLGTQ